MAPHPLGLPLKLPPKYPPNVPPYTLDNPQRLGNLRDSLSLSLSFALLEGCFFFVFVFFNSVNTKPQRQLKPRLFSLFLSFSLEKTLRWLL